MSNYLLDKLTGYTSTPSIDEINAVPTVKHYFNLPEHKNKTMMVNSNLGVWKFENCGTKLSFDGNIFDNIESYDYIDCTVKYSGNRIYLMNNGSFIGISIQEGRVQFRFINDFAFILDKPKWA
jgi:hypothetical protein